jgi:hypothetical protein
VLRTGQDAASLPAALKDRIGLWLLATPTQDVSGAWTNVRARLSPFPGRDRIQTFTAFAPEAPVALDAVYDDHNLEYHDIRIVEAWSR